MAKLDAVLASPEVRCSGALPGSHYPESPPARIVEDNSGNPALTGVQAVAALLVVATHAAFATGKLTHGYVGAIYARLEIGVALFFVLSGFLLFRRGWSPRPPAARRQGWPATRDTRYAGSCPATW